MRPDGNDLRLKDRTATAHLAILGWGEPSVPVQPVERKLAAIFAADVAGYSRLMARDEVSTLERLKAPRRELLYQRSVKPLRGAPQVSQSS